VRMPETGTCSYTRNNEEQVYPLSNSSPVRYRILRETTRVLNLIARMDGSDTKLRVVAIVMKMLGCEEYGREIVRVVKGISVKRITTRGK